MKWKPLFAVLLGLLMIGVSVRDVNAIVLRSNDTGNLTILERPLLYPLSSIQSFEISIMNGTTYHLTSPSKVYVRAEGKFLKIIQKFHFRNLNISKITLVNYNDMKTLLVITPNTKIKGSIRVYWNVQSPLKHTTISKQPSSLIVESPRIVRGRGKILIKISYSDIYSKLLSSKIQNNNISLSFGPFILSSHERLNIGWFETSIVTSNQQHNPEKLYPFGFSYYYHTPFPAEYPLKRSFDIYDEEGNVVGRAIVVVYGSRKRGINYAYLEEGVEGVTTVGYAVIPKIGSFHSLYTKFEFCGGYFGGSHYANIPIRLNYEAIGGNQVSDQFIQVHKTLLELVSTYINGGEFLNVFLSGLLAEKNNKEGINSLERRYYGPISITSRGVELFPLGANEIGQYYTYTLHLPYELDEDLVKFCLKIRPGIAVASQRFPTNVLYVRDYSIPIWITLERP